MACWLGFSHCGCRFFFLLSFFLLPSLSASTLNSFRSIPLAHRSDIAQEPNMPLLFLWGDNRHAPARRNGVDTWIGNRVNDPLRISKAETIGLYWLTGLLHRHIHTQHLLLFGRLGGRGEGEKDGG